MKYVKGQRVRVVGTNFRFLEGMGGVISDFNAGGSWARIIFPDYGCCWVDTDSIEPADAPQPQADPLPVGDYVSGKEHAILRRDRDAAFAERDTARAVSFGLRAELADAKGNLDAARARVATLEGDVAYLTRECVRLGGKARGCR